MSDSALEFILYAGILLTVIGLIWLLVTAFHRSVKRGIAVALIPILAPWHVVNAWPRTIGPALLLVAGLGATAFPLAYTRWKPIDLGKRVRMVDGEKHLTLTGWDRPDYAVLAEHPDCVVLQMANPDVDDATLQAVAKLESLRELDLDGTAITDAGLALLRELPRLERLRISRTTVTDAGFRDSLATIPSLRQLWCPETGILKSSLTDWKAAGEGRRFVGGQEPPAPQADPN